MPKLTNKLQHVVLTPLVPCHIAPDLHYVPAMAMAAGFLQALMDSPSFSCTETQVLAPELSDSLTPVLNMRLSIQILKFVDHDCSRHLLSAYPSHSF